MTLEKLTEKLAQAGAVIADKRLKINFGADGIIMLDGVANRVSNDDDGMADATIAISWDDWIAIAEDRLDPMSAYLKGRLRLQGDMGLAMKLQGLFSRLKAERG